MQSCVHGVWYNKERCREGCKEDACVERIRERECTDKDGQDFFTAGITFGVDYHGEPFSKGDRCATERDLVEYSCKDGYLLEDGYICPGRCVMGACEAEEGPEAANETEDIEVEIIERPEPLPAPEPVVAMPETKGLFGRFWGWLKGIFSRG
jgi:hypothetical protein